MNWCNANSPQPKRCSRPTDSGQQTEAANRNKMAEVLSLLFFMAAVEGILLWIFFTMRDDDD
jgi:hypothetical protein